MIVSFRDGWLRDVFIEDKIPPEIEARLFRKIQMIDDARDSTRFASTNNGGRSSDGTGSKVRHGTAIWTPIVTAEVRPC